MELLAPSAVLIAISLVLACIPAFIASSKGRSFGGYFVFGTFLFVPALIVALLVSPAEGHPRSQASTGPARMDCPRCAESVAVAATMCRFCNLDLTDVEPPKSSPQVSEPGVEHAPSDDGPTYPDIASVGVALGGLGRRSPMALESLLARLGLEPSEVTPEFLQDVRDSHWLIVDDEDEGAAMEWLEGLRSHGERVFATIEDDFEYVCDACEASPATAADFADHLVATHGWTYTAAHDAVVEAERNAE